MAKAAKKAPKKKGANAYKLPDPIPAGEILTDLTKKQWILGTSIGVGGFGEIYSAAPYAGKVPKEYSNVIKIEPHGNGPLFVEMHFYMRNAKPDEIDRWKKEKKLSTLGMPRYIGSGSHECNKTKYRFVVMERYGTDLWKLFEQSNRQFPEHTVYKLALQIANVLEYIHHKTYVHADIKGANLLLDLKSQDQVYLVDFGLASHYTTKSDYKFDPKKAHNGTIEYTSRDAHMGVPTMRGDFEILGYNIIQWLCGRLPWEKNLADPVAVQNQKLKAFENIPKYLKECFQDSVPEPVQKYMTLLDNIKFNDTPDYDKFREILIDGLKRLGHKPNGKLEFKSSPSTAKSPAALKSTPQKRKILGGVKKRLKNVSPIKKDNLNDSTIGVVIDKKRGGAKDIQKVLNDIESDGEYDIKIVKKKKLRSAAKTVDKAVEQKAQDRSKRVERVNYSQSESDSEPEVISKGTRSRPRNIKNTKSSTKNNARLKPTINLSASAEEDMFDDC